MPKRRRLFVVETDLLNGLQRLAEEGGRSADDCVAEALKDLLKKHGVPLTLKDALMASRRAAPANDRAPVKRAAIKPRRSGGKPARGRVNRH